MSGTVHKLIQNKTVLRQVNWKCCKWSCDDGRPLSDRTVVSVEGIQNMSIITCLKLSVHKSVAKCLLNNTSIYRILRNCLKTLPNKLQTQQPFPKFLRDKRLIFAKEMLHLLDKGSIDSNAIWFYDETGRLLGKGKHSCGSSTISVFIKNYCVGSFKQQSYRWDHFSEGESEFVLLH